MQISKCDAQNINRIKYKNHMIISKDAEKKNLTKYKNHSWLKRWVNKE